MDKPQIKIESQSDLINKTDEQIKELYTKYSNGCNRIFNKPGYFTAKGDALYEFQCQGHKCPQCTKVWWIIHTQLKQRTEKKQAIQNKEKTLLKKQIIRKKYFNGQPGCQCNKQNMCKQCFSKLQNDVTTYEKGCGATWIENFGGMAAGEGYVYCKDNWFLCQICGQELAFINSLNKEYPHVKLEHIPQQVRSFWSPKSYPYYQQFL